MDFVFPHIVQIRDPAMRYLILSSSAIVAYWRDIDQHWFM